MLKRCLLLAGLLFLIVSGAFPKRKPAAAGKADAGVPFDYYLLTLSWAPDFCAAPGGNKDPRECGAGKNIGFVVHGMWPQNEQPQQPKCPPGSPVSQDVITPTLRYIPTESLIQHEWTNHGACTGLSSADYFAKLRQARDSVKIPSELTTLKAQTSESAAQIEAQFAAANPGFPPAAFRATCTNGALQEARICLDKNLSPRACTASAGRCSAPSMKVLPPR